MSAINERTVDGSFDYNYKNGKIVFRLTTSFKSSIVSKELFDYVIDVSASTVDEYNDKLEAIAKDKLDLEKFIKDLYND